MENKKTAMLLASKKGYPEQNTIDFLGKINKPELVDAYERIGRQVLSLDVVKSGGRQTRKSTKMKNHIIAVANDFASGIDYSQQPPMVFKNKNDYTIVIGEHRLQAFIRLGLKYHVFDVIDLDLEHKNVSKEVQLWYSYISNRSNDHRTNAPSLLVETSSSILSDIDLGLISGDIFKPGNEKLAKLEIKRRRPSAVSKSLEKILYQVQTGTGGATSGTFVTLVGKHEAKAKAIECGFSQDINVCTHDFVHRAVWDLMSETTGEQELLIFINSSSYSLTKETIDNLRDKCITGGEENIKSSYKNVKTRMIDRGISEDEINRIKIGGFLPQGNKEPSTQIIPLTIQQKSV
jgi:hypothetical protein|tara:strand:+ start:156 stop:1199 length:1044 start_codon:yes stop_codon:yes gene_type:complete